MQMKGLRWWVIALIALATIINYIDRQALSVLWPDIVEELFPDESALERKQIYANISIVFVFAYAFGQAIFGKIFDLIYRKLKYVSEHHCLIMKQDILNLIEAGQYLIAIKRYREQFQVGFSEAEKAVFDIRKDITEAYRYGGHASDSNYDFHTLCARIRDYLMEGNKLRAVRCYQDNCRVDFAEAMKMVTAIEQNRI